MSLLPVPVPDPCPVAHAGRVVASLFCVLLLTVGCAAKDWDPSRRPSGDAAALFDTEGRALGTGASTAPLDAPDGIRIGDDEDRPRLQDSIVRGTGDFVRQISPPVVDTTPGDVTLNFDGTDIREVVKVILGDLLRVNYVLDPAVQGSASLQTGRPLRRELLLPTLETLLRMNNAALVERAGTYEVVPLHLATRGRVSPQLGDNDRALPHGYRLQIVPLRFVGAKEMATILEPLAPEGSLVRVDGLRNLLVIAAAGPEMRNLLDTIDIFDVDWMAGLSVGFFTLEYAKAGDVTRQMETLLADEAGNPFGGVFRFIPLESANALLVVSSRAEYLDRMRDWIDRLDLAEASGSSVTRLYVYRVRYGNAENLATILGQLFAGDSGARARPVGGVAPGMLEAAIGGNGQGAGERRTASASKLELSSEVSIVADAVNNSLLVRASPPDYKKILDALKQLDILPLQVLIEATIVEVTLAGSLRYGLQWQFFNSEQQTEARRRDGIRGGHIPDVALTPSTPLPTTGFNWSVILRPDIVRARLSALASDGLVNVLSSPSVMVMDNQEAKIQVGQEVPIATTQQQGVTANDRILQQIQYRSTGVILTVTPRVTPGGLVQMDIKQEVSTVDQDTGPLNSPTFRTRNITSNVAVRSNQSVVLGGLIQDSREDGQSGVPGLYRAPVIGPLFGQTSRRAERTELMVILTPRVIANDTDIDRVTEDFRRKVRSLQDRF